ncbi:hypothetical protein PAMA_011624 [Pampus argenteus]
MIPVVASQTKERKKKKNTRERDSQDTVTPSDIINKQNPTKRRPSQPAPASQPASQPATILTGCWKRHTQERKEANAYFDQQTKQSELHVDVVRTTLDQVIKVMVDSDNRD